MPQSRQIIELHHINNQLFIYHWSYMRISKVLAIFRMLHQLNIDLCGKAVLDYGFGAGTFFRYCPQTTKLYGVELNTKNVQNVAQMLQKRGVQCCYLQTIAMDNWFNHPLLTKKYDLVVCSHVLEHLEKPVELLTRLQQCLKSSGFFVGLVPINERYPNPKHLHTLTKATIRSWAAKAGYEIVLLEDFDPWTYYFQYLFAHDSGWQHRFAQTFSIILGVPATFLGSKAWYWLSRTYQLLSRARSSQLGFVMKSVDENE